MKPFLVRHESEIWYIIEKLDDGRRRKISTKTRDRHEAEQQLLRYVPASVSTEASCAPFLTQFIQEFHDHMSYSLAPTTVRLYTDAFASFLEIVGNVPVDLVSARDIDRYVAMRVKRIKPITVNKELSTLKAAFNHAVRWGYIEKNPFVGIRKLRVPEKMPVYFTRDEVRTLIDGTTADWLRDIIIVAVATGMRMGEMLALTWPHVDLTNRVVKIVNTESFRTKTGKYRVVPLNGDAKAVLDRRRQMREKVVFTQAGLRIKQDWLTHAFKKTIRRLGMRDELHFHALRHTFASWLVQDGVSLYQVGRLLGHADTKTTEIYAHLQPETMHDIVDRLNL
ncbi:MAG: tyrosine-type recombinase/integrase [Bacteroidetes bacterium]|nr:tyrosine-type recombinase/integrase [Bacteroidota bacterium]